MTGVTPRDRLAIQRMVAYLDEGDEVNAVKVAIDDKWFYHNTLRDFSAPVYK